MPGTCSQRLLGSALALALLCSASSASAQTPAPPSEAELPNANPPAARPPDAPNAAPAPPGDAPPATGAASTELAPAAPAVAIDAAAEAEAAAIEADMQSASASDATSEFKLNFYGFADFTYAVPLSGIDPYVSTFAIGKLNLYAAAELGDNWRSLSEIRFMYLPHGGTPASEASSAAPRRTDTTVPDYADLTRPARWGGISIERAWLEHTFHPLLTVRAGQWLTPYGIWNVDHGSPVIIGVARPFIVGDALFPQYQTGLEAYGAMGFGPSQLGYHLTLSNGRGPIDSYKDLDHNKAVGVRLYYRHDGDFGVITAGVSGYRGRYTDARDEFAADAGGAPVFLHPIITRYDELSLAADVKWEWDGLLAQGELITNDVAYDDRYRPVFGSFSGPPGFNPDHRKFGYYALAGYRTPFLGIMPWLGGGYYDPGVQVIYESVVETWLGLNARPTPRVVLKAQWTHVWAPGENKFPTLDLLDFQAAWSF
jgi:hypothetical protein